MTPLLNFASNVPPAQAVSNAVFGAVVVPELQAAYGLPNGTVLSGNFGYNGNGVPFPAPITRAISRLSLAVEAGIGITAGSLRLIVLRPDGNWHLLSGGVTIAASTNYYQTFAAGLTAGSFGGLLGGIPFFGLAIQFGTGLAGGNINFLETEAMAEAIDPGFIYGSKLGALIQ